MSNCTSSYLNVSFGWNDTHDADTEHVPYNHDVTAEAHDLHYVMWVIMGVLICTCNAITVLILIRMPRVSANHTTMHLLLGNLALADSLVGVILLLLTSIEMQKLAFRHNCVTIYGLFMLSAGESTTTLTMLAFDRYKAIVKPLGYRMHRNDENTVKKLAITWAFWAIVGLVPVLPLTVLTDNPLSDQCRLVTDIERWHVLPGMVLLHGILYIVILVCNYQIIKTIKSKNRIFPQMTSSLTTPMTYIRMRQHLTLTRKVLIITTLFFICWIPFQVMITILVACPYEFQTNEDEHCGISGNKMTVPATMATLNSLVNFFVYVAAFKKFRTVLVQLFSFNRKKFATNKNISESSKSQLATQPTSDNNTKEKRSTDFTQLKLSADMYTLRSEI